MQDPMDDLNKAYEEIIEPKNLIKNMNYDEFVDWAEIGTKEDIECAIRVFQAWGLKDHVKIMKIIIERESYKKV